jgi:hypothetical protein
MITIDKFNELTSELIGQPLTQVSDSYGDVVVLHFGNLTNYTHPKLSDLMRGEYELVIKMSNLVINGDLIIKEVVVSFTLNLQINQLMCFLLILKLNYHIGNYRYQEIIT